MAEPPILSAHGVLVASSTLKIERLLPGPIQRIWAYLTEGELRRQWLAAGDMELQVGAPFELIWRKRRAFDTTDHPASPKNSGCQAGSSPLIRRTG